MTTLVYGALGFAEASIGQVSGEACLGFYRLLFQVTLQVHGSDGLKRFQVGDGTHPAELRDLRIDIKLPGRTPARVGRLHPEPRFLPVRAFPDASSVKGAFAIELSADRLEALEAARNGGDLTLELAWLSAIADGLGTVHHSNRDEPFVVGQSDWIKVLGQLGYAKLMLLEVPLVEGLGPAFADATGHLMKAKAAILRGEYREAVGCCRDVIEALSLALGDKDEQLAKLLANTRELDKAGRLRLVRQALKMLTHPARHADAVAANIEWTRTEAVAVVTMTAAIMQTLAAPDARTLAVALS